MRQLSATTSAKAAETYGISQDNIGRMTTPVADTALPLTQLSEDEVLLQQSVREFAQAQSAAQAKWTSTRSSARRS
jgi:hypothetical protein